LSTEAVSTDFFPAAGCFVESTVCLSADWASVFSFHFWKLTTSDSDGKSICRQCELGVDEREECLQVLDPSLVFYEILLELWVGVEFFHSLKTFGKFVETLSQTVNFIDVGVSF
jgi:hypothetical protein